MFHSILLGKTIKKVSQVLRKGSGSTWPGHLALKTDRKVIQKIIKKNPQLKVVFIAGTNGKTTTTKALSHILSSYKIEGITNESGANLLNGLASTLIHNSNPFGKLKQQALIFEVDENSLPLALKEIPHPTCIILLNLFRDQLDRYGEVNIISQKWKEVIEKLDNSTLVIGNADDPQIAEVTLHAKNPAFFTIDNTLKKEKKLSHAVDSTSCPKCRGALSYSRISYSHLGNYTCPNCGFQNPKAKQYTFESPLLGNYNFYNLTAAILAVDKVFGINPFNASKTLNTFKAAFGRQEFTEVNNKKIMILLSKNPTGFNESLTVVLQNKSAVLLVLLNDRVPDGRDISWIWDVDFEKLKEENIKIFVSGDRGYDMANRLLFAGVSHEVFENFDTAYRKALEETPQNKTLTILPTYSAMLEIRKQIFGKAIL